MLDTSPDRRYGFSEELREGWMRYSPQPPLKDQALMLTVYPLGVALLLPLIRNQLFYAYDRAMSNSDNLLHHFQDHSF